MTVAEGDSQPSFDRERFHRAISEAQAAANKKRKEIAKEKRRLRLNPKQALAALGPSIERMADLFGTYHRNGPSTFPMDPKEKLWQEAERFRFLSGVVQRARLTDLPKGFDEAIELVEAMAEQKKVLNRVNKPQIIPPQVRMIPAGQALQDALRKGPTPPAPTV